MSVVNATHKMAFKAAVATLAVKDEVNVTALALSVQDAAVALGLQVGNMTRLDAIADYALGARAHGERQSNRRWTRYTPEVQRLAGKITRLARIQVA